MRHNLLQDYLNAVELTISSLTKKLRLKMFAYKLETTITENGNLNLQSLPFEFGEEVEVIILRKSEKLSDNNSLSFAQAAKKFQGCIKNAPADLSTNPNYMQGFGE
ncbi:hypothetical protein DOJK_00096 [Patescibacteria group bacterium]|nr:hypothetical protein DOJK_00096 [Patescibacteria group bacterium]